MIAPFCSSLHRTCLARTLAIAASLVAFTTSFGAAASSQDLPPGVQPATAQDPSPAVPRQPTQRQRLAPEPVEILPLRHVAATEIVRLVSPTTYCRVVPDPRTNSVLIAGPDDHRQPLLTLIRALDVPALAETNPIYDLTFFVLSLSMRPAEGQSLPQRLEPAVHALEQVGFHKAELRAPLVVRGLPLNRNFGIEGRARAVGEVVVRGTLSDAGEGRLQIEMRASTHDADRSRFELNTTIEVELGQLVIVSASPIDQEDSAIALVILAEPAGRSE